MNKKVSCIIPAYNEEKTIVNTIKVAVQTPEIGEVITVNDGSEDKTKEKIKELTTQGLALKAIHLKKNRGKGYAVIRGVQKTKYPNLLFLDADLLDIKPSHLSSLTWPVLKNQADMVIGPQITYNRPLWLSVAFLPFYGQRCLKKKIIQPHLKKLAKTKYGLEVALNQIFRGKRVLVVPIIGVKQVYKHRKEKDWVKNYAKEIWQITQKSIQTKSEATQQRIKDQLLFNLFAYLKLNAKKIKEYIES
jgi:glycosyltransferase involved in cell wall biosynthesis